MELGIYFLFGVNMRFNKQISFSGVHMQVVEQVRLGEMIFIPLYFQSSTFLGYWKYDLIQSTR